MHFVQDPVKKLNVDGPQLIQNGLNKAVPSCEAGRVCFSQDAAGKCQFDFSNFCYETVQTVNAKILAPTKVTIEGDINSGDPYVIVLTQDQKNCPVYVSIAGKIYDLFNRRHPGRPTDSKLYFCMIIVGVCKGGACQTPTIDLNNKKLTKGQFSCDGFKANVSSF